MKEPMDLIDREELLKDIEAAQKVVDKILNGIVNDAATTTLTTVRKIVDVLPSIDAVDRRALVETIKHYAQYPDGMSRLLEVYGADMRERRTDE